MKLREKLLLLFFVLTMLPVAAQASFGRFHALVIGNQNYRHLKKLETPLADAKAVAKVLREQYGFTVDLLLDADRDQMLKAVSRLRSTITNEQDNLLIYYAGHGFLDKYSKVDYWQPIDSEKNNDVYWVPTSRITDLLRVIRAKHVLIVADSCYSGSLLMRDSGARLASGMSQEEWLRKIHSKRSRTALTSGAEEPVRDSGGGGHSVFAKALLDVLRKNKAILDGDSLFDRIKRPVALNSDQTPQYGDIRMTGHEMGDFLLV
ncbi:caspase family protein, partial [Desulfobulbus sp. TB]|nr:caspase family protein [Desulfobulbus sp. TB]